MPVMKKRTSVDVPKKNQDIRPIQEKSKQAGSVPKIGGLSLQEELSRRLRKHPKSISESGACCKPPLPTGKKPPLLTESASSSPRKAHDELAQRLSKPKDASHHAPPKTDDHANQQRGDSSINLKDASDPSSRSKVLDPILSPPALSTTHRSTAKGSVSQLEQACSPGSKAPGLIPPPPLPPANWSATQKSASQSEQSRSPGSKAPGLIPPPPPLPPANWSATQGSTSQSEQSRSSGSKAPGLIPPPPPLPSCKLECYTGEYDKTLYEQ